MAVYDLEEQEQLDELKTWWKQYGNLITAVVVAVSVGVIGWQGWNWWQRNQAGQAAAVYAVVEQAAREHDAKKALAATGELTDKFSGTAYAGLAALLSSKLQVDAGDLKTAKLQLGWAVENARGNALRDLARLRLAAVLLDEKAYDEALKQLAVEPAPAFAPRYAELKGDIFVALGKPEEARTAYQTALAKLDAARNSAADQSRAQYRDMLQVKLEALGGKKP
ncbi:MAG: tetratricopeptide repeat protein [Betaproteobacteria bacterium]|nr:tetratricopeptide repeat protein [Betaproteobacteria bacterium]